jgi:transposase
MSKARLVITAVVVEGRSQAEVARSYGVSAGWVSKLVARYRSEGDVAFEPRSRHPRTSPGALSSSVVERIVELRTKLSEAGLDAGPDTIRWHLSHHGGVEVSSATISRYLVKAGLVTPSPEKRPQSSYISASRLISRTSAGSPTSPTTGWPVGDGRQAPTSRFSPGWTTIPGWRSA